MLDISAGISLNASSICIITAFYQIHVWCDKVHVQCGQHIWEASCSQLWLWRLYSCGHVCRSVISKRNTKHVVEEACFTVYVWGSIQLSLPLCSLGIGYFTLPYLVHAKANLVYACEWNPAAVEALNRNLQLNGVDGRCVVLTGDNRQVGLWNHVLTVKELRFWKLVEIWARLREKHASKPWKWWWNCNVCKLGTRVVCCNWPCVPFQVCPKDVADHVNLGLIPSSEEGWATACAALKSQSGGILHIHGNVTSLGTSTGMRSNRDERATMIDEKCECAERNSECQPRLGGQASGQKCEQNTCEDGASVLEQCKNHVTERMSCQKLAQKAWSSKRPRPEWQAWAGNAAAKIKWILQETHHSQWETSIMNIVKVKSYAPRIDHLVLDLQCVPKFNPADCMIQRL